MKANKLKVLKVNNKKEAIIRPEYAPFYTYKKKEAKNEN